MKPGRFVKRQAITDSDTSCTMLTPLTVAYTSPWFPHIAESSFRSVSVADLERRDSCHVKLLPFTRNPDRPAALCGVPAPHPGHKGEGGCTQ